MKMRVLIPCVTVLLAAGALRSGEATSSPAYHVTKEFYIPGDGDWDYIAIDSDSRRLYVSHETVVDVLDADSGKIVGRLRDTPGVHGVALAPTLNRGFTSNGSDDSVTIFDTKSLTIVEKVPLGNGTDFILYDAYSGRVFPLSSTMTVLDARSGKAVGTLNLGGSPEEAVSDGKGSVYVNLANKSAVAVIDPKGLSVVKMFPLDRCRAPLTLAYDNLSDRLFIGCTDGFVVVDPTSGKIVARNLMCSGVDSSGFDTENALIFQSCKEGVISVLHEVSPDFYELLDTVKTQLGARTMAFDSKTKRIYLPTSDFETIRTSDLKQPYQRQIKAGSFRVLVVER